MYKSIVKCLKNNKKASCAVLLGGAMLVNACYIQAKAYLAQFLIANAFEQQQRSQIAFKPWPWADTEVIAKLSINGHKSYILRGASMRNLAFGPTLMGNTTDINSDLKYGNSVIVGHRDTHFSHLQHAKVNDIIEVEGLQTSSQYKIAQIIIVDEYDTRVLSETDNRVMTLITCYPFNDPRPNPSQRLIVRAYKLV